MDDYMFKENVARCKVVEESTRCLEMFSYSVFITEKTHLEQNTHRCRTLDTIELKNVLCRLTILRTSCAGG